MGIFGDTSLISPSPEQLTALVQSIGIVGIITLIIWTGYKRKWVFDWVATRFSEIQQLHIDTERQRAERAEAEVARYRNAYEEKVLPMLDHSNQLLGSSQEVVKELAEKVDKLAREISELKGSRS